MSAARFLHAFGVRHHRVLQSDRVEVAATLPDAQTQEQRGLLRARKQLTRERTSHVQRLQKTLEEANIKLDSGQLASLLTACHFAVCSAAQRCLSPTPISMEADGDNCVVEEPLI